ncbi:MAG: SprB repeat-containing protein [Bacteroidetes bacterium]|nr:SprB repeat-containing protein [Bacteroidota bacterium]
MVVTQPTALTATYNAVSPGCSGGLGSITVTGAGGTPAYSYTLNPGAVASPTGIFTGLATGLYSITVTDANLCETIITGINITAGSAITAECTYKHQCKLCRRAIMAQPPSAV